MTTSRIRLIAILLAASAGIVFTCAVYYPGVMSPDSIGTYQQAISGTILGRTKTPLQAFLWIWILKLAPGPFGLLLFQSTIFWTGLALIVSTCRWGWVASVLAITGVGLFPAVFGLLGMLWSDVLLGASLTLFVGLALMGAERRSRVLLALSVVPLWCGLSARVNAPPAVVPLAVWLVTLWYGVAVRRTIEQRVVAVTAILLLVGLFAASKLFDRAVIATGSGSYARAMQFAIFHDLAGIAVSTGDLRLPVHVYRALPSMSLDVIRQVYDPADVNLLIYNPQWDSTAFLTTDRTEFVELVRLWVGAIRAHPGAYVGRRADALAAGLQIRGVHYPFHIGIDPNDLGLQFEHSRLYDGVTTWLNDTRGIFFRGWAFALVALGVVVAGAKRRHWSAVAVCASGLFYIVPYVAFTIGADFRYVWWLVVSTLIGILLFAREEGGRSRIPAGGSGIPPR